MYEGNLIHPTAIISSSVKMGKGNVIGPYVQLEGDITLGDENEFISSVIITNRVHIGSKNQIYPFVTIGHLGEMGYKGDRLNENGQVIIGDQNIIREFVNIHSPVRTNATSIGDHCYIMNKSYLAHDVKIGNHTSLTAGTKLAGRAEVGSFANMGMGSSVHQRIHVGDGAMVGMNAVVIKDIPPYAIVAGVPARIIGFNRMAAIRRGYNEEMVTLIESEYKQLLKGAGNIATHDIVNQIRSFHKLHPNILLKFKE